LVGLVETERRRRLGERRAEGRAKRRIRISSIRNLRLLIRNKEIKRFFKINRISHLIT
jgi:hypothetical protein